MLTRIGGEESQEKKKTNLFKETKKREMGRIQCKEAGKETTQLPELHTNRRGSQHKNREILPL